MLSDDSSDSDSEAYYSTAEELSDQEGSTQIEWRNNTARENYQENNRRGSRMVSRRSRAERDYHDESWYLADDNDGASRSNRSRRTVITTPNLQNRHVVRPRDNQPRSNISPLAQGARNHTVVWRDNTGRMMATTGLDATAGRSYHNDGYNPLTNQTPHPQRSHLSIGSNPDVNFNLAALLQSRNQQPYQLMSQDQVTPVAALAAANSSSVDQRSGSRNDDWPQASWSNGSSWNNLRNSVQDEDSLLNTVISDTNQVRSQSQRGGHRLRSRDARQIHQQQRQQRASLHERRRLPVANQRSSTRTFPETRRSYFFEDDADRRAREDINDDPINIFDAAIRRQEERNQWRRRRRRRREHIDRRERRTGRRNSGRRVDRRDLRSNPRNQNVNRQPNNYLGLPQSTTSRGVYSREHSNSQSNVTSRDHTYPLLDVNGNLDEYLFDNTYDSLESMLRDYKDPAESDTPLGAFLQQITASRRVIISRVRKRITKQYFKRGDYHTALANFRSLDPEHTSRIFGVGFTGTVNNMYRLTVKKSSSFGQPTFEIRPMNKRVRKRKVHICYKIRYINGRDRSRRS